MAKKQFSEEVARERKNARQREYAKKTGFKSSREYNAKTYRKFTMPLRLDIDEDLINFVEEQKENGKSPTEVFREVGVFYLEYHKKFREE